MAHVEPDLLATRDHAAIERKGPIADVVTHFDFVKDRLVDSQFKNVDNTLLAPMAMIHSPNGFGEAVWTDAVPCSFLSLTLNGAEVRRVGRGAGERSRPGQTTVFVPRGRPTPYVAEGAISWAIIYFPDTLLDRARTANGQEERSTILDEEIVFPANPVIESRAREYVARLSDRAAIPTALELEARSLLLLDELVALSNRSAPVTKASGGLAPRHLRRVLEFLEEHVEREIVLSELAELTDLSVKHFSRAFKQSTGVPPHQWLIGLRITRAKRLLSTSKASLAEVAVSCGFADQSHFTATFRKIMAVTPAAFRRDYGL